MRVTDLDEVTKATTTAGKTPGFTVETVLEMEFGKAYMLGGLRLRQIQAQPNTQAKPVQDPEASETFVIVTAERLDWAKQAAAPNTGPLKQGFYSPIRAVVAPARPKPLR